MKKMSLYLNQDMNLPENLKFSQNALKITQKRNFSLRIRGNINTLKRKAIKPGPSEDKKVEILENIHKLAKEYQNSRTYLRNTQNYQNGIFQTKSQSVFRLSHLGIKKCPEPVSSRLEIMLDEKKAQKRLNFLIGLVSISQEQCDSIIEERIFDNNLSGWLISRHRIIVNRCNVEILEYF